MPQSGRSEGGRHKRGCKKAKDTFFMVIILSIDRVQGEENAIEEASLLRE